MSAATRDGDERPLFGFWVFLMSDAVIFALLIATYGVMLPATMGGPTPASEYEIGPIFIETLILLTSSFTFAMATVARRSGGRGGLIGWLAATLALGLAFLAMEGRDFVTMFADGAVPSRSGFLSAFFALVPLHGLHVAAGAVWIVVMIAQVLTLGLDDRVHANIARLALFWHFLDVVWLAIFSVVYLPGMIR